jgi:hypothetical protein
MRDGGGVQDGLLSIGLHITAPRVFTHTKQAHALHFLLRKVGV